MCQYVHICAYKVIRFLSTWLAKEVTYKHDKIYCTISINLSATVMRDAPDENIVLSGGWDECDKYKISSGSGFFFSKLVGGHLFLKLFFFAI